MLLAQLLLSSQAFSCGDLVAVHPMVRPVHGPALRRRPDVRMKTLAEEMFGDVFKGVKSAVDSLSADGPDEPAPPSGDQAASELDARAQAGTITFDDFITMASAFAGLGDDRVSGVLPGKLSAAELAETRQKLQKHERIVEVMLPEERADPELLIEDVKSGGSTPGPRLQRLAKAVDVPETEIALFVMQFDAMRESTRRIAAGEDPDEVNTSMSAPPGANRAAKRAAQKNAKKAAKKKSQK